MEQRYTSANTSINSTKLPYVFSKVAFPKGRKITDYGCGKHIKHIKEKVNAQGCEYVPYDPFNLPDSKFPKENDITVCSNVLNVIAENDVIENIIKEMCEASRIVLITVYEGNGSGVGKVTGADQYQRNEKTKVYASRIREMGYEVTVKNRIIRVEGRVV